MPWASKMTVANALSADGMVFAFFFFGTSSAATHFFLLFLGYRSVVMSPRFINCYKMIQKFSVILKQLQTRFSNVYSFMLLISCEQMQSPSSGQTLCMSASVENLICLIIWNACCLNNFTHFQFFILHHYVMDFFNIFCTCKLNSLSRMFSTFVVIGQLQK